MSAPAKKLMQIAQSRSRVQRIYAKAAYVLADSYSKGVAEAARRQDLCAATDLIADFQADLSELFLHFPEDYQQAEPLAFLSVGFRISFDSDAGKSESVQEFVARCIKGEG